MASMSSTQGDSGAIDVAHMFARSYGSAFTIPSCYLGPISHRILRDHNKISWTLLQPDLAVEIYLLLQLKWFCSASLCAIGNGVFQSWWEPVVVTWITQYMVSILEEFLLRTRTTVFTSPWTSESKCCINICSSNFQWCELFWFLFPELLLWRHQI